MAELDEEQAWISLSQQGDHAAFAALITRYQRMIHALTFRMTGSLAEAEDLAQETFILAHAQLASFRGEAKFSSWLYRIAVNLCLNWQKSQRRRQQLLNDWAYEQEKEIIAPAPDSRTQYIQEALLKLNPKQRAAVSLTVYDGLNHAQAARALGCAETTVSWRVFAARSKLKKWLAKLPSPEETHEGS
jgi:RNA polymerase sigma-70 factor, ECF subfamily